MPNHTFEVTERGSTDGGEWRVWRSGGKLRTAIRQDYGESGTWMIRYEFETQQTVGIEARTEWYLTPLSSGNRQPVIQRILTERYFICDGAVADALPTPTKTSTPLELLDDLGKEPLLRDHLRSLP